jgi:hypothetical protein
MVSPPYPDEDDANEYSGKTVIVSWLSPPLEDNS